MAQRTPHSDHDPHPIAGRDSQLESPRGPTSKRTVLPLDLAVALANLPEDELQRLASAMAVELKTRRTGNPFATEGAHRPDSPQPGRQTRAAARKRLDVDAVDLPTTKVRAIRAAIQAGVKPTLVARQFGVTLSAIRKVLTK